MGVEPHRGVRVLPERGWIGRALALCSSEEGPLGRRSSRMKSKPARKSATNPHSRIDMPPEAPVGMDREARELEAIPEPDAYAIAAEEAELSDDVEPPHATSITGAAAQAMETGIIPEDEDSRPLAEIPGDD